MLRSFLPSVTINREQVSEISIRNKELVFYILTNLPSMDNVYNYLVKYYILPFFDFLCVILFVYIK